MARKKHYRPGEKYARDVVSKKIVAGPAVRGMCRRFLDDLKHGEKRHIYFDDDAASRAIRFFPACLTVETDDKVVPFELLDWQEFVIANIFGWIIWDWSRNEYVRRYRRVYIETGKGSGKSPLAAGIGLLCMIADGVESAEVYAAATIKSQAMILFKDATKMVMRSPGLKKRLTKSGGNPIWQWTDHATNSIFKPLSQEEMISGPRPNCALIDEYHEHKTSNALDMMEAGFKGRKNPLLFVITNSGQEKATPCGYLHDFAMKIATGDYDPTDQEAADRFFSFITCLDEGDDPLNDESCWPKANPSLGHTIQYSYLRQQVATAKAMPAQQNIVLRLNFCVWTDAAAAWVTRAAWEACETELDLREINSGKACYNGLDLSYTTDLSAKASVWPRHEVNEAGETVTFYDAAVTFWKPKVGLLEAVDRDRVRYDVWADQGHLVLTPGEVIKLGPIGQALADDADAFDLKTTAYDNYRHKELQDDMTDLGLSVPMSEHPQGFRRAKLFDAKGNPVKDPVTGRILDNPLWMPDSCQELENAIIEKRLRVQINYVLRWNVGGVVIREDPSGVGNYIFDKRRATTRIDGLVALAMAIGAAKAGIVGPKMPSSPFDDPEFSLPT